MDGLSIGQQDHTQITTLPLRNLDPPANSAVSLDVLANRLSDRALDPLVLDYRSIGALANRLEVGGDLHCFNLPERCRRLQGSAAGGAMPGTMPAAARALRIDQILCRVSTLIRRRDQSHQAGNVVPEIVEVGFSLL